MDPYFSLVARIYEIERNQEKTQTINFRLKLYGFNQTTSTQVDVFWSLTTDTINTSLI